MNAIVFRHNTATTSSQALLDLNDAVNTAMLLQSEDAELAEHFAPIAKALSEGEGAIVSELASAQGGATDLGGYYHTDPAKAEKVMRPSATLNAIIG